MILSAAMSRGQRSGLIFFDALRDHGTGSYEKRFSGLERQIFHFTTHGMLSTCWECLKSQQQRDIYVSAVLDGGIQSGDIDTVNNVFDTLKPEYLRESQRLNWLRHAITHSVDARETPICDSLFGRFLRTYPEKEWFAEPPGEWLANDRKSRALIKTDSVTVQTLETDRSCRVCQKEYVVGEKLLVMICGHKYHETCMKP